MMFRKDTVPYLQRLQLDNGNSRCAVQEANTYRQYEANCRRMAATMNEKDKSVLLKKAQAWDAQAEEAQRIETKKKTEEIKTPRRRTREPRHKTMAGLSSAITYANKYGPNAPTTTLNSLSLGYRCDYGGSLQTSIPLRVRSTLSNRCPYNNVVPRC
ncbi:MAG: hypothetical protein QOF91_769 [Alphaproteobacteria bacterium]|jgi:hypothetical protein|nr:hypothetical protein [Alphaproteobacteria bacterium]